MTGRGPCLLLLLLLVLGGCGATPRVATPELEEQISSRLTEQVGQTPAGVTCEEPLPAEVGEAVRCELTTGDGTRFGLSATTTSVEGSDVRFDIAVDEEPAQ